MLVGQETLWFLLVLFAAKHLQGVLVAWFSCSVWQFGTQKKA
jgi:hypothetical protein